MKKPVAETTRLQNKYEQLLIKIRNSLFYTLPEGNMPYYEDSFQSIYRRPSGGNIIEFLNKYPELERWRLFVDGCQYANNPSKYFCTIRKEKPTDEFIAYYKLPQNWTLTVNHPECSEDKAGWLTYENTEPGSIAACIHAFDYMLHKLGEPLDGIRISKEIHKRISQDVKNINPLNPGEYRFKDGKIYSFGLSDIRITEAGIKDLLENIANENLPGAFLNITKVIKHWLKTNNQDLDFELPKVKGAIYICDAKYLKKLKRKSSQEYDSFLNAISATLCSNDDFRSEYFTVGSKYQMKAKKLLCYVSMFKIEDFEKNDHCFSKLSISKITKDLVKSISENILNNLEKETAEQLRDKIDFDSAKLFIHKAQKIITEWIKHNYNYLNIQSHSELLELVNSHPVELCNIIFSITAKLLQKISSEIIKKRVEEVLRQVWFNYNQKINKHVLSDDERIQIIGNTVQALERIHPFSDGNGRTFVNIILNMLLLQNGFPVATFYEPNLFDAFDDIAGVIKKAILNTLEIYDSHGKNPVDLFGFETQPLEDRLKKAKPSLTMSEIIKNAQTLIKEDKLTSSFKNSGNTFFSTSTNPPVVKARKLLEESYPKCDALIYEDIESYRNQRLEFLTGLENRLLNHEELIALEKEITDLSITCSNYMELKQKTDFHG